MLGDELLFEKEIEGLGKLQVFRRDDCAWITVKEEHTLGWAAVKRVDGFPQYTSINSVLTGF